MKHKLDTLIISLSSICKECGNMIEIREAVSLREQEKYRDNMGILMGLKLGQAHNKLRDHECSVST